MKKYLKIFWLLVAVLAVAFLQLGLIDSLPAWYDEFNLVIFSLIIGLFFFEFRLVLVLSLILGFLLDVFSFQTFGLNIISLLFSVILADFLLVNWFTNRSIYSFLALSFFVALFYNFFYYLSLYFLNFFEERRLFILLKDFWLALFFELLFNFLAVFLFFFILNLTTNKLKLVFLDKK